MATGVTINGPYAYVTMDNFSMVPDGQKPAFRGIVVIDMKTESVVARLDGMDPGADAVTSYGSKLVVSFMGMPLWRYALDGLQGSAIPEPELRIWKFPIEGHPIGKAVMDDTYYYTCYAKAPHGHGGGYHRVPVALSLKQIFPGLSLLR